jgi:NADH-quinone oxidoreductase subunit G
MCDEGRYAYHAIDTPARLKEPQLKQEEAYLEASWADAIQRVAGSLKQVLATHGPQGVAMLVSPQMTNEELFLVRRIFGDQLGIRNIESRVPSNTKIYSDDFLITADKNPNTRGADLLCPPGPGIENLVQACAEGHIHFLYILQHDLTRGFDAEYVRKALARVECIVFQGSWAQPTADMADIRLPAAVYAEKEGTFTNVDGRVQKFQSAVPPLGNSLPDLDILCRLASDLGISVPRVNARELLEEIGKTFASFAGMTWQSVGSTGQSLNPESGK